LPRSARWLIAFGAFVVAYFAIVEPVIDATLRMSEKADRQEAKLAAYRAKLKDADAEVNDVTASPRLPPHRHRTTRGARSCARSCVTRWPGFIRASRPSFSERAGP
jgi:hypothetical protein